VEQFSGLKFILWVILPSLAGAAAAWASGPRRIARARPWFRLVTLADILVLNYANASLAVEKAWASGEWSIVALSALLAAAVSLVGIALAVGLARGFRLSAPTTSALLFGLSMKHTGLALVIAGEFLKDQPRVVLVILLTTLAQHVAAGAVDWRLARSSPRGPSNAGGE
jgi:BASS family bile acid:Na+ symporter